MLDIQKTDKGLKINFKNKAQEDRIIEGSSIKTYLEAVREMQEFLESKMGFVPKIKLKKMAKKAEVK